jgi:hypothetical protein
MTTRRPFNIRPVTVVFFVKFLDRSFTSFTHDKRLTFFDSYNRNEKQIKIMIHPLVIGLVKAANRTSPGRIVKYFYFRRNATNQKHLYLIRYKELADCAYILYAINYINRTATLFWR